MPDEDSTPETVQPYVYSSLVDVVTDLRYCPICAYPLETVSRADGVVGRRCVNHNTVFQVWRSYDGYGIKVDLNAD